MKVVAFITEYAVADQIIAHLKLTFVAAKPPPSHVSEQVALAAAELSWISNVVASLFPNLVDDRQQSPGIGHLLIQLLD
jgi:hypothetical protein